LSLTTAERSSGLKSSRALASLPIGSLSLSAYFCFTAIPLFFLRTYEASLSESVGNKLIQAAGIVLFALLAQAISRPASIRPQNWTALPAVLWLVLIVWCVVSAVWSISATSSIMYGLVLAGLLLSMVRYWQSDWDELKRVFFFAWITILLVVVLLGVALPFRDRTFGWVPPNLIGHYGLTVIVMAHFTRLRTLGVVAGLVLIAFAQARTVAISAGLFLSIQYLVVPFVRSQRAIVGSLIGALCLAAAAYLLKDSIVGGLSELSTKLFQINSAERGLASGFTGRDLSWASGWSLLTGHEWLGYGFRTRADLGLPEGLNAHSGILNILLDIGIPGLLLLAATYAHALVHALAKGLRESRYRIVASFLLGMLPILVVEPNYLNFSHPTSFLFFLFLASSVLHPPANQADPQK
jgi:hypothetical protein